ncbi:MAG TPA: alpha/beta fold hydrolase [Candidatus Limnocylindrales bacterium]|nr:alpha/beta fold hydrolase [Candidatus Limnocylindrales bacterium]
MSRRSALAFVLLLGGLLVLRALFGDVDQLIVVWPALGVAAGAIARHARRAWLALVAGFIYYPAIVGLGLAPSLGPWWFLQGLFAGLVLGLGFALGGTIGPDRRPWLVARSSWAEAGTRQRAVVLGALALSLAVLGGYVTYAGVVGSETFLHPDRDPNCTTPAQAYGWTYEAINYDIADDAKLAAANPDPTHCSSQGATAGNLVRSPDGVPIAGWYIPSADGSGPTGPTVILVHGWHGNKSGMLPYAKPLHDRFNLVLIDLRDDGRSGVADVTMGLREQTDLEAMIDWLVATKQPSWIGAVGNSMGGATVLAAAAHDQRIRAVILESTHATLIASGGNIAENEHGYPAQPTGWAIITFTSWRIGADVTSIDPVRTIGELGNRPVLLIHGTADRVDYPATSAELNFRAALAAGVPAELEYCQDGTHGSSVTACPDQWSRWANDFFGAAAGI